MPEENKKTAEELFVAPAARAGSLKELWSLYIVPELQLILKGALTLIGKFITSPREVFSPGMVDVNYLCYIIVLTVSGLAVHYSASYRSFKQVIYAVGGLVLMLLVSQFRIKAYKLISCTIMGIATAFLFIVFAAPEINGTNRWFFGKLFQPSEFGKVALIMFFAYLIEKYKDRRTEEKTFLSFFVITLVYAALILAEKHLSGAILFFCIGYAMMWYGGLNKRFFAVATCIIIIGVLFAVWKPEIFSFILKDYQIDRVVIWKKILFNGEITAKEKLNNARQVLQSLYGIGSGGLFGVGFGKSGQKVSNLSEKANDFIFAVIGEEFGFIGSMVMIAAFAALVIRGFRIAFRTNSYYGALLVLGISTQIALQVIINIAVTTSILPNTGISLPFFSEGGSSMIFTMISMGLVLGVSKDSEKKVKKNNKKSGS